MEPEPPADVHRPMRRLNPTVIALLGGVLILLLLIAYFAGNRNPDQDKLKDSQITKSQAAAPEKRCSSQATYDLIKRELFRRAAKLRGSDQAAYDRLAAYAVVRMENPVLENQDQASGSVTCSGSLSLDLPPGVAAVGGRRSLMSDVDYTLQPAADDSGVVVLLRNADSIIAPLATLARIGVPAQAETEQNEITPEQAAETPVAPATPQPVPSPSGPNCAAPSSRGEAAVCSDAGLASLDRNTSAQYSRALSVASAEQQALLRSTRDRFLAYRDRCPDDRCISDAYAGRMREIRDIMEGRWQSPR